MGADIGILTETKIDDNRHTLHAEGYDIVCTKAASAHQGGVAICYKSSEKWHIEGTRTYGPNVINAVIVSGTD